MCVLRGARAAARGELGRRSLCACFFPSCCLRMQLVARGQSPWRAGWVDALSRSPVCGCRGRAGAVPTRAWWRFPSPSLSKIARWGCSDGHGSRLLVRGNEENPRWFFQGEFTTAAGRFGATHPLPYLQQGWVLSVPWAPFQGSVPVRGCLGWAQTFGAIPWCSLEPRSITLGGLHRHHHGAPSSWLLA